MIRLAIITTHPIQYNAPYFELLTTREKIDVKVFYTWGKKGIENKYDPGFGKAIQWDIPLLTGYDFSFVENIAKDPGSHHFGGIDNPRLVEEIEKWKADALLVFGWNFKSHLKCIRHFHGKIPVYFRGDSVPGRDASIIKRLLRKLVLAWVYKHVDKVFYVGTENKKYFLEAGLRDDQLVFAPHAIDNERFFGNGIDRELEAKEWRHDLKIPDDCLVLLYAGKLEPVKNLGWLIETIKKMPEIALKVIIAGNGPDENSLKEQARGADRFIFLDFQNQQKMPVLYRLADVFVLCSHSETWGLSVNEAMACGRAVLASDSVGCAADLVRNGINGYVFNSNDQNGFLSFVAKFASDKNKTAIMGQQSKNLIKDWNFESICDAIETTVSNKETNRQ